MLHGRIGAGINLLIRRAKNLYCTHTEENKQSESSEGVSYTTIRRKIPGHGNKHQKSIMDFLYNDKTNNTRSWKQTSKEYYGNNPKNYTDLLTRFPKNPMPTNEIAKTYLWQPGCKVFYVVSTDILYNAVQQI